MPIESATYNGKEYVIKDVLDPWRGRKDDALAERKIYLPQIRINRKFAAGQQWLEIHKRDGRVQELPTRHKGMTLVQSNVLDQYLLTVIGRLSATDYLPNFLVSNDDPDAEEIARHINMGFQWGWEHEWNADEKIMALLRYLVIDGTCGVRVRFDGRVGALVGDAPYRDGVPILDEDEAAKYVAEKHSNGESANIGPVREGKIKWELLTMDNMLWPAGYEDPNEFPWEIIERPVSVQEIKSRYGEKAEDVHSEDIESTGSLLASYTDGEGVKIEGKCMVYTGYEKPNQLHPKGRTVVFTDTALLDVRNSLPLSDHPLGPRSGVHYFRWQVLPGRFVGKAFIQNGIDGQKLINKRLTQMDNIVDRNMPVTYIEEESLARRRSGEPFEYVEVRPGAPLPKTEAGIQLGGWWIEDFKLQEQAVEKALGIRGVSMGSAPQGVSAYSAMALLTENDSLKLDSIAFEIGLGIDNVCWDTMEQMRNWPRDKHMMIAGEGNRLQEFFFDSNKIPHKYLLKRSRGTGTVPRSQAAEIQKINDIWSAAAGRLPLSWYVDSLNAGKPLAIPPSVGDADNHKAELENILMLRTYEAPPVAPYDNHVKHVETHRAMQSECQARADAGDEEARICVEVIQSHIDEHEAMAAQGAMQSPAAMPPMPGGPPPMVEQNTGMPGGASLAPQGMEGLGSAPTG